MKKSTINLEQSRNTKPVQPKPSNAKVVQEHTYTVISLVGRIEPKIGSILSEKQVEHYLVEHRNTTVNIKGKK